LPVGAIHELPLQVDVGKFKNKCVTKRKSGDYNFIRIKSMNIYRTTMNFSKEIAAFDSAQAAGEIGG
jgi:hypothetical protein